jgi:hypothetical protein
MLPANRDDRTVHVHRTLDADEEDLLDAITEFAVSNGLEIDRSFEGDGLLFRAARDAPENAMFRNKDTLRFAVERTSSGVDVTFDADMAGLAERGDAWRRGRMIRGSIFAAVLVGVGVSGLTNGVNVGDFVPVAIGGLVMARSVRSVQGESDSREAIQREVANALHRVCDDAERD